MGKLLNAVLAVGYGTWGMFVLDSNPLFAVVLLGGALCLAGSVVTSGPTHDAAISLGYLLSIVLIIMAIAGV